MGFVIKYSLDNGAFAPTRGHLDDAGLDLRARTDKLIYSKDSAVFDVGVHVAIPWNHMGEIVGRSGLNINHSIIVPKGTVDCGYTGSIKVKLYNLSDTNYEVHAGDKIAQLIIVPIADCVMIESESLDDTERGDNGFGSTGR